MAGIQEIEILILVFVFVWMDGYVYKYGGDSRVIMKSNILFVLT